MIKPTASNWKTFSTKIRKYDNILQTGLSNFDDWMTEVFHLLSMFGLPAQDLGHLFHNVPTTQHHQFKEDLTMMILNSFTRYHLQSISNGMFCNRLWGRNIPFDIPKHIFLYQIIHVSAPMLIYFTFISQFKCIQMTNFPFAFLLRALQPTQRHNSRWIKACSKCD